MEFLANKRILVTGMISNRSIAYGVAPLMICATRNDTVSKPVRRNSPMAALPRSLNAYKMLFR